MSASNKTELKITNDGSHTLYSRRFDQYYHNPNGSVAESKHVFFEQNGLMEALDKQVQINILEIGFGTGLNLLLLMDNYLEINSSAKIMYHSIEGFPISRETAASLNYADYLRHPKLADRIPPLFDALKKGINSAEILPDISATIFYGLFDEYSPQETSFDFIFHDAFSPDVNPGLWTGSIFKKLFNWSKPNAILSTYCAASKAKGAMAWASWNVAKAEGALGKREMTVASPSVEPLKHLKRVNEKRLAKRYAEGDF